MIVSKSTGNDIVALKGIDKQRSNNAGFYSKILSVSELALYCSQVFPEMPFENFLWMLWSVKESVYKYRKRTVPGLIFSPAKIIVQQIVPPYNRRITKFEGAQWESGEAGSSEEFYRGTVLFESDIFHFRSKIHAEFISTVVNEAEDFENIRWGVKWIDHPGSDYQSSAVRAFVLNKLDLLILSDCSDCLRIEKNAAGYPIVLKGAEEMGIPVSFAHHDHFIAYSFLLAIPH